jgi:hypothetical protein
MFQIFNTAIFIPEFPVEEQLPVKTKHLPKTSQYTFFAKV